MSAAATAEAPLAPATARVPLVDAARGAALVGMAIYHLVWDLGFFGLIPRDWPYDPRFVLFGHAVAASFLALVGVSLALAARDGLDMRGYWRRLATIAGAALLVTVTTWWIFPDSFIFFGVLHCIAAASVLALAFLNAPWPATLAAGAAVLAAPWLIAGPAFEPIQWWSGLGAVEPRSNDWRPLFPWAGFTLVGLALTRAALAAGLPARIAAWRAQGRAGRVLVGAGRRSLLIYLVHQPVLLAFVFLAAQAVRTEPVTGDEGLFLRTCTPQCVASGGARAWCEKVCACVLDGSKREALWPGVALGQLDEAGRRRYGEVTQQCVRGGQLE